jgi:hypothetical protein
MAGSSATQELFQFLDHVGRIQKSIWNLYLSAQMSSAEQWCWNQSVSNLLQLCYICLFLVDLTMLFQ